MSPRTGACSSCSAQALALVRFILLSEEVEPTGNSSFALRPIEVVLLPRPLGLRSLPLTRSM